MENHYSVQVPFSNTCLSTMKRSSYEYIFSVVFCIICFVNTVKTEGENTTQNDPIGNEVGVISSLESATPNVISSSTTRKPTPTVQKFRLPCSCAAGQCGCCTGYILDRLNQKICMNMTADPEDFSVSTAMYLNGKVWYKNTVSGKNPPPMCIRLPRFRFIRFCVEFSNIYIADRNIHLCIDAEANWEDLTLLEWSFDCVRMGLSGVAVVRPEDGGGLPGSPLDEVEQTDEDYDDSARKNTEDFKNIVLHESLGRIRNVLPNKRLIMVDKLEDGNYILRHAG